MSVTSTSRLRVAPQARPASSLNDFVPHKVLGAGSQGTILVGEKKATGKTCAPKTISKHTLTPSGVKLVLMEQATMKEMAECPFFPRL